MTREKKNLSLDEIVSIMDIGEIDTYDFSIANTHCFFANGILVHNTGTLEEAADTVILLFWPHFYNEKIDKNLYKIIIAKQRNGRTADHFLNYIPEYYKFIDTKKEDTNKIVDKLINTFDAKAQ